MGSRAPLALITLLAAGVAAAEDLPAAARRVASELAAQLAASPERSAVRQIAVPAFIGSAAAKALGAAAAEQVATELARATRLEVLDPARLSALLGEARLALLTGGARADDPELLRKAGAQAVVAGQVLDEGDRLRLSARLLAAPGGKVLATGTATFDLPRAAPSAERRKEVESTHVDVAMRRVADGLAAGFAKLAGSAKYRRLAVLAFSEDGEQARKRQLGTVVAAELTTNLRRDHGLLLVERQKLGQVLGDLKLQQMTGLDAAATGQIGQLADAQALVLGSVADAGERYLINARIVAAGSGETLAAESASVPAAGMVALASDAVVLRSRSDAVFRSLLVPGWGQFYNRQRAKGWVVMGTGAALVGSAVGYHLAGQGAYRDYRNRSSAALLGGSPSAEAAALYETAASRYRTRNWLLGGLATLWVFNVADAWLSGVDGEAALQGGLAAAPTAFPGGAGLVAVARF
jgi:TolB-like protein